MCGESLAQVLGPGYQALFWAGPKWRCSVSGPHLADRGSDPRSPASWLCDSAQLSPSQRGRFLISQMSLIPQSHPLEAVLNFCPSDGADKPRSHSKLSGEAWRKGRVDRLFLVTLPTPTPTRQPAGSPQALPTLPVSLELFLM